MANKRRDNSAGTKIRHYIYAQLRNNGDQSVALPSSYELAAMFNTTRRVARYELELLIAQGVLIAKPRIGTFTNPRMNYINVTPIQKKMLLIGIIDDEGQRFCYGRAENLIRCYLGLALSSARCYVHYISFSCCEEGSRVQELKALGLDGIIWYRSEVASFPSDDFLRKVEDSGIPVVVMSQSPVAFHHGIEFSSAEVEKKLVAIFKQEQRKKIAVLSNLSLEYKIAARIASEMGIALETIEQFQQEQVFSGRLRIFSEKLRAGYRPDVLICEPMFAETIPEILSVAGIDIAQECRLVACNELNSEEGFKGFIMTPDILRAAQTAIDMLFELKRRNEVFIREIPYSLREILQ